MQRNAQRNWCFTIWHPLGWEEGEREEFFQRLQEKANYYVVQLEYVQEYTDEEGALRGGYHFQGFLQLAVKQRWTGVKRLLHPTAHLEPMKASSEEAAHYCKKPQEGCDCEHCTKERLSPTWCGLLDPEQAAETRWEWGEFRSVAKKVKGLARTYLLMKKQKSMKELLDDDPSTTIRNIQNIRDARQYLVTPRSAMSLGVIIWGAARVGKTYWAYHAFPKPFMMPAIHDRLWFGDYDPVIHETIIFGNRPLIN